MFGNIPAGAQATGTAGGSPWKRAAEEAEEKEERKQRDINEALAKLTLMLEGERRANARSENMVLVMDKELELAKTLEWAEEQYKIEGERERKEERDCDNKREKLLEVRR